MKNPRFAAMPATPAKMCVCGCQRLMAFPKRNDGQPGRVGVYLASWDGNPFYDPKIHARHLRKRWAAYAETQKPEPVEAPPSIMLS